MQLEKVLNYIYHSISFNREKLERIQMQQGICNYVTTLDITISCKSYAYKVDNRRNTFVILEENTIHRWH